MAGFWHGENFESTNFSLDFSSSSHYFNLRKQNSSPISSISETAMFSMHRNVKNCIDP